MLLLAVTAHALTLDEAVRRASELDPARLVADANAQIARIQATEAWATLALTPSLSADRTYRGGGYTDTWALNVSTGLLDVGGWMDGLQKRADAKAADYTADAARIDAEYAAAVLYVAVVAGDASALAARRGEEVAEATLKVTEARASAGIESELMVRSARVGVLAARVDRENADMGVEVARLALARVLQVSPEGLVVEAPGALSVGELTVSASPVVAAARAAREAAGFGHAQRIAELFPTGSVVASSALDPMAWSLSIGFTWTFDGVIGPYLRAREASRDERIATIAADAVVRDAETAVATALAQSRHMGRVAELAREREQIAEESLKVAQTRLAAGIASSLEVLRLQDEAAIARSERIAADLNAATATLTARQAAGVAWAD